MGDPPSKPGASHLMVIPSLVTLKATGFAGGPGGLYWCWATISEEFKRLHVAPKDQLVSSVVLFSMMYSVMWLPPLWSGLSHCKVTEFFVESAITRFLTAPGVSVALTGSVVSQVLAAVIAGDLGDEECGGSLSAGDGVAGVGSNVAVAAAPSLILNWYSRPVVSFMTFTVQRATAEEISIQLAVVVSLFWIT
ncbi:hypothetical protein EYF80_020231 [Liparis tanakae]|uniref:Uncharacterized protein n=1 Tax=Liparis tanakae TaxID=230148 RepID=A0A4Z2HUQ5_9TELE|nr:hypothetical protein EYF80_020231 [Liparis tanakae]